MRRVILLPIGSSGDVNPFIWIGRHLREQGHEVSVIVNPYYARHVESEGLRLISFGTEEEYHRLIDDPMLWHPTRGTPLVLGYAGEFTKRHFDLIQSEIKNDKPLLLAPAMGFGARLAREKFDIPLVSVNLQPSAYRSIHEPPYLGRGLEFVDRLPRWLRRAFFKLVDLKMGGVVSPGVARACRGENIPPPRNAFRDWWQSPDGVICLWPEWFSAPQPDWPANARCIGFPLEDLAIQHSLNSDLESFLAAGEPPVLFTPGTAMAHGREFFQAAIGACAIAKRRALLITRYPAQLPAELPSTMRHFDYLPFSDVLPRCAAIVHHGGIGTTSQSLAASIPQLIMPLAHDQPDNAERVRKRGVGRWLWPDSFTSENVARELEVLLSSQDTHARCAAIANRMKSDQTVTALLEALAPHLDDR